MSTKEPKKVQIVTPKKEKENFGFRTDNATGKFIIADSDSEDEERTFKKSEYLKSLYFEYFKICSNVIVSEHLC